MRNDAALMVLRLEGLEVAWREALLLMVTVHAERLRAQTQEA